MTGYYVLVRVVLPDMREVELKLPMRSYEDAQTVAKNSHVELIVGV